MNPIFRFRVNVVFHLAPPIIAAAIIEQSSCTNRRYPRGNCSITSSNIRSYAHRAFVPIGPRATLGLGVTFNRLLRLIARIPSSRKSQMVFRMFEANSSRNSSNLSLCIFILGNSRSSHRSVWGAVIAYFVLFFVCIVSVTPKSTCPPLTSFSEVRSSRRINLSVVRLRLLLPDSAAGASFLVFGVFTLAL